MVLITAQVVGGAAKALEAATVAEVRAKLGLATNYQAAINGEPAEDTDNLEVGNFVTFAPQVKGAASYWQFILALLPRA